MKQGEEAASVAGTQIRDVDLAVWDIGMRTLY